MCLSQTPCKHYVFSLISHSPVEEHSWLQFHLRIILAIRLPSRDLGEIFDMCSIATLHPNWWLSGMLLSEFSSVWFVCWSFGLVLHRDLSSCQPWKAVRQSATYINAGYLPVSTSKDMHPPEQVEEKHFGIQYSTHFSPVLVFFYMFSSGLYVADTSELCRLSQLCEVTWLLLVLSLQFGSSTVWLYLLILCPSVCLPLIADPAAKVKET